MNDDFVAIFYQHLENVKTSVFKNHLQREYDAKSTCSYVMQILVWTIIDRNVLALLLYIVVYNCVN